MSDTFRRVQRALEADEVRALGELKDLAEKMLVVIHEESKDPRHSALAKTKLEEAVMWAVKGITA